MSGTNLEGAFPSGADWFMSKVEKPVEGSGFTFAKYAKHWHFSSGL